MTASTEGTVAAIFAHIRYLIELEIDRQEEAMASGSFRRVRSRAFRPIVLAEADQVGIDRGYLCAESGSDALAEWTDLIDGLRDRILRKTRII